MRILPKGIGALWTHQLMSLLAHLAARLSFEPFSDKNEFLVEVPNRWVLVSWIAWWPMKWATRSQIRDQLVHHRSFEISHRLTTALYAAHLRTPNAPIASNLSASCTREVDKHIHSGPQGPPTTMQLYAVTVPIIELASLSKFLFGSPRDILYDPRDLTRASIWHKIEAVLGLDVLEKG